MTLEELEQRNQEMHKRARACKNEAELAVVVDEYVAEIGAEVDKMQGELDGFRKSNDVHHICDTEVAEATMILDGLKAMLAMTKKDVGSGKVPG